MPFYKGNYEISIVMEEFYTEFERPFSPARTYNNYYKIVILILVLVGGLIYLFTLILLGGINKKDLDMISPKLFTLLPRFLRKNM